MQDEIAALRRENEQLKRLLQSLSDKLQAVLLIIGDAVQTDIHPVLADLSNDKINNSSENLNYSYDKNINGINAIINTHQNYNNGISENVYSILKNNNGINKNEYAFDKNKDGISESGDSYHAHNIGKKPVNEAILKTLLRGEVPKSSDEGIENTAKILIQLQSGTPQSYAALRRLTHLSASGMAKRIMALKKKGLIVRTGFQLYSPTPKSFQMLENARQ